MMKPFYSIAPYRFLAGIILLSIAPFMVVKLFNAQLYRVMEVSTYLVFHNMAEFFSVMVSLSIFSLGWYAFDQNRDRHALYLSVVFLAIGLMDFMHTLGYAGMPALLTANTPNKSTQFWIAVRLFSAAAFLSSAYVYPDKGCRWLSKTSLMVTALAISAIVFVEITFFPDQVPTTFVQGVGLTHFKVIAEYVIIALLVLATLAYWQRLSRTGDRLIMYYLAAFVLCIFSELVFSSYQSVFDTYNVLGHLYKVLAFILIYKGIFVASVRKPYEDLRQHRNMLSQIINSIPQSIFWKDTHSVYLGCNRVFARSAGLAAPEDIVGKRDLDLPWGSAEAAKYCADDREVMEHAQAKRHIIETQHQSDGTTIWIDTSKIPLIGNTGTVEGVLGVYEDVTRRKQVEEELVESNRHLEQRVAERTDELLHAKEVAEAANRSKSTFLANMSHEIRTPLNAVLGFSQIVLHDPNLSAENRHNLQTVNRSGEHLLTLINDVLDMAKIESGRLVLEQAPFDLPALLADVTDMFTPRATAKDLKIVFELQPDMLCHVQGDAGKLRQVLINLLGNAVKFTEQGGVSLRARTFRRDECSWLEVAVEDSGPGIGPQDQQRVFDAFEQSEVGRKSQGGTGLGLAISRQYAHLMGGDLTVTSQPGQGACFRLTLPVIAAQPPDSPSGEQPCRVLRLKPGQPPCRVLVVDDRDTNREILVKMLAPLGFTMIEAQDGQAALEAFFRHKPCLILMDVVMPVMDGREAIRRIRALPEGRDVPIIAVSASVFDDQFQEVMAAGASDFLRKPLREEELYAKLVRYLPFEFEYAAEAEEKTDGDGASPAELAHELAHVPTELRDQVVMAARGLDKTRLLELLAPFADSAPELAKRLRSLVDSYRFDLIEELVAGQQARSEQHD